VHVLCSYEDMLVAGGAMNVIGFSSVGYVAGWRQNSGWFALGNLQSFSPVQALAVYDGSLIAHIDRRWNGSSWVPLAGPVPPFISPASASVVFGDQFVAAGNGVEMTDPISVQWARWSNGYPTRFTGQPSATAGFCAGDGVALSVVGEAIDTYQWRRDGVALVDGPTAHGSLIQGAQSTQLELTNVQAEDAGTYDCVGSAPCGTVVSGGCSVTRSELPADVNGDFGVDAADLSVLLGQFGQSVPAGTGADMNGDGLVNSADLSVLLGSFGQAC
jgi:hypothetical protein